MMKLFITVLVFIVSGGAAQQWPAQITAMDASGNRMSPQANTFPIGALGGGPFSMGGMGDMSGMRSMGGMGPMGQMGGMGPMGSMGSMGSFPQGGPQRSPFSSMQMPSMSSMSNFGNQMPPMQMPIFGGRQMPGGQMPFLPIQSQQRQQSQFGGGSGFPFSGFPSINGQRQQRGGNPFSQLYHPRQFGQKQFQPSAEFQQNSSPQEADNFVQKEESTAPKTSEGSLPKFLEGAPEETITEFKRIIRQPNVTYDNKMKEVETLVGNLDDVHQQLYHQFMDESDKTQQTKRDAIHKTVGGMSEDAQGQFAKISAILTNPALPEEERWNRILTIYGKLEPSLRNEFEEKFKPLV